MKLSEWMKTDERSRRELAALIGVNYYTFCKWVQERAIPLKHNARIIRQITGNKVTLSDFHKSKRVRPPTTKE